MDVIRKIGATQTDSNDRPVNPIVIDGEFWPSGVCIKPDLINSNILSLSLSLSDRRLWCFASWKAILGNKGGCINEWSD